MAIEIERKFLLRNDAWRADARAGVRMRQAYLRTDPCGSVRVRISAGGAILNVKCATSSLRRLEFEYPIPVIDAETMLTQCCATASVEKTRYPVGYGRHQWEIDVFTGSNTGLVLAEIELESEDEVFDIPEWLGEEVSEDPRYFNMNLAIRPWSQWP